MPMVVKNNKSAVSSLNNLNKNSKALSKSLKNLSSGMKINGADDDASGYSISERMRVQIRGLSQDDRNTQNAQSMVRVAEGAVGSTVEILRTLKEKALDAANDTNTDEDRAIIQKELDQYIDQIDDNAMITFNGRYLVYDFSQPVSPQASIKTFMHSLDKTSLSGQDALDETVRAASGNVFHTMDDLVSSFLNDYSANVGAGPDGGLTFLKEFCDIDLTNDDTGAITGMDAGWFLEKTAESVVPEWGPTSSWDLPTTDSTTIQGLTINWVNPYQTTPLASLTAEEQAIIRGLNSEWMDSCLTLIQDSFGMNFEESGTTIKSIDLQFHSSTRGASSPALSSGVLAAVGSTPSSTLSLIINMDYYDSIVADDVHGSTTMPGAGYLDRTLAHEFTHAVMAANVNNFNNLPLYIKEGMAELVHGIDDERIYAIKQLTQSSSLSTMEDLLTDYSVISSDMYTGPSPEDPYAGGYILLRYLAKQGSSMDRLMNDITFQVGTKANQSIKIGFADMRAQSLGLREANGENISLATRDKATVAIHVLDTAVRKALDQQTTIGAILSRLEYTSANLGTANENTQFSESTIRDADMAKEMTEYTRNNVLMQSAQSMLAQANQNSSSVLSLLQ